MDYHDTSSQEQHTEDTGGGIGGEYVVCVITETGYERIMSVAKHQEEAAIIAENLRNGGYSDVSIRRIK